MRRMRSVMKNATQSPPPPTAAADGRIATWLLLCGAMVFAMVVLGGVTRLTGSGLSMVEWRPVTGILPPLSDTDWTELFAKYRTSPEFREIHPEMTVDGFKAIFWLEYLHRMWGRVIGAAFLLPFLYFIVRGTISRRLAPRLGVVFVLGGLQGLLGWYMVKSGLIDRPEVSQYRLVAHLALALIIYAYMIWVALGLLGTAPRQAAPVSLRRGAAVAVALIFVTALAGGFVAGLDAGMIYNSFPLMGGGLVPAEILDLEPWWRNAFENPAAVQFCHRVLAVTTVLWIVYLWLRRRNSQHSPSQIRALHLVAAIALLQAALGIATLILSVPVALAATHQAGALALLTAGLWLAFLARPAVNQRRNTP